MEKVPFNKVFTNKFWSRDKKALALIYALGILTILITIFICNSVYPFSPYFHGICYESEIGPGVFIEWEVTERLKLNVWMETVRVKNPDRLARIKEIKMELFGGIPDAYCYWIGSTLHRYEWNSKTQCYEAVFALKFEELWE